MLNIVELSVTFFSTLIFSTLNTTLNSTLDTLVGAMAKDSFHWSCSTKLDIPEINKVKEPPNSNYATNATYETIKNIFDDFKSHRLTHLEPGSSRNRSTLSCPLLLGSFRFQKSCINHLLFGEFLWRLGEFNFFVFSMSTSRQLLLILSKSAVISREVGRRPFAK